METAKLWVLLFTLITLFSCGGGGGDGDGQIQEASTSDVSVAGVWQVREQVNDINCGGTGTDVYEYSITVNQDGAAITVVTPEGTFTGSLNGNEISWQGQYFDPEDAGWITITNMSLTKNGNTISGSASWEFRETQNGPVVCSGTTQVTGNLVVPAEVAPAPPQNFEGAGISESAIKLDWLDNSDNELGFHIERSLNEFDNFVLIGTTTSNITTYTDTNLESNTIYYYLIRAYNNSGNSDYSNTVSVTTQAPPAEAPSAPIGLQANASSSSSISLNWNDKATNESGYKIERSLNEFSNFEQIAVLVTNAQAYIDDFGLQASTAYFYRIRAFNSAGDSDYSDTVSVTSQAPPAVVPSMPIGLQATATSSSTISLNWNDQATNETGYKIERSLNEFNDYEQIAILGANAKAHIDNNGLIASMTYYYRVRAYNDAGNSNYTSTVSVTTQAPPVTVPNAPTSLQASATSSTSINLTWNDQAINESGYKIERSLSESRDFEQIAMLGTNAKGYTNDTGLQALTTYYYRARAYNSAGNSDYSNTVSVTTKSSPVVLGQPSLLGPSTAETDTSFDLSWTYNWPSGRLASTADGYVLEESSSSQSSGFTEIFDSSLKTAADHQSPKTVPVTVNVEGTYYYRVKAVTFPGVTDYSNVITVEVSAPQRRVLRIVNDLFDQVSGQNDWGKMNGIIRVRIGPTQASVENSQDYERMWRTDSTLSVVNLEIIEPAYQETSKYRDFDIDSYRLNQLYYVYIQTGWWEYFCPGGAFCSWQKHMTAVAGCNINDTVHKWSSFWVDHESGLFEVKASDFLPIGSWYQSPFCQ